MYSSNEVGQKMCKESVDNSFKADNEYRSCEKNDLWNHSQVKGPVSVGLWQLNCLKENKTLEKRGNEIF